MKIQWSNRALISYIDNLEFILLIWNEKTTLDFIELVQDTLNRLKKNPFIGKPFNKNIPLKIFQR
jgi:plasmid stabilization system protein ParE